MTRKAPANGFTKPGTARGLVNDFVDMSMADHVRRTWADLRELDRYYNIGIAPRGYEAFEKYHQGEKAWLRGVEFGSLDQEGKVDYILLKTFHTRQLSQLSLEKSSQEKIAPLLPFAAALVQLLEDRQDLEPLDAKAAADTLNGINKSIIQVRDKVLSGGLKVTKTTGYLAAKTISGLVETLREWSSFYSGYDPAYDYWVTTVYKATYSSLGDYLRVVKTRLAGQGEGNGIHAIVGEPIGREGLIVELGAEMIPYTPEELLEIGNQEYRWCEKEMIKHSEALGYGSDWHKALEHVKNDYVEPGQQAQFVKNLVVEGSDFVTQHDLVTVPPLADAMWRMTMIAAERQKVSPFFLGGRKIQVSYPVASMDHDLKLMVMRGNNKHYARATAFHEMIPGHRLQLYMADRYNSHRRRLFDTPFYVEGWALYWEFLLYERDDFHGSAENRIGALFWRMHRCLRIIFSLKFHMGEMTAQEAVELLVDKIHHERSNAEGEVRRSVEGSDPPLYQAAYMLGALQLWKLREMVVDTGRLSEKEFHDAILRTNMMPVELVKALIMGDELSADFETRWKFYSFDKM